MKPLSWGAAMLVDVLVGEKSHRWNLPSCHRSYIRQRGERSIRRYNLPTCSPPLSDAAEDEVGLDASHHTLENDATD